jgi:hypothetical protein
VLYAPEEFELSTPKNREAVVKFLRALRELVVRSGASPIIDFSRTEKMVADGTLLLIAEVWRIVNSVNRPPMMRSIGGPLVGEALTVKRLIVSSKRFVIACLRPSEPLCTMDW